MLAVALFTLFGLVSPSIRRPLARIFVLVTAFTTIAMLRSSLGVSEWNLTHGFLAGGLILALGVVLQYASCDSGPDNGVDTLGDDQFLVAGRCSDVLRCTPRGWESRREHLHDVRRVDDGAARYRKGRDPFTWRWLY